MHFVQLRMSSARRILVLDSKQITQYQVDIYFSESSQVFEMKTDEKQSHSPAGVFIHVILFGQVSEYILIL